MEEGYKYTLGMVGQSHFMGVAIDAIGTLETTMNEGGWEAAPQYFRENPVLRITQKITAFSGMEVVGAVMAFTATCFAKKVFDEFYDRLMKRKVGECVEGIIEKFKVPDGKLIEFRDVVYFSDIDLAVVVRFLTKNPDAKRVDAQLIAGHRIAYDYVLANGRKAPVHCHRILEGKVDADPEFFVSMDDLQDNDRVHLANTTARGLPAKNLA
ncbi:hypothetical protein [Burkholderia sp. JKS000303]|uniref:hypothetical protein n=1 Tax=Burkholderia sp. JKS000303 TaxID=1938747 RepID=UPI00117FE71C|nr:hypothetical protein [Burkholderia sp. JKS000303]